MKALVVARRLIREIVRDRRTLAFFFMAPLIVMSLMYYALLDGGKANVALVTKGAMDLFRDDLEQTLAAEPDINLIAIALNDELSDPKQISDRILTRVKSGEFDAVLYLSEQLLVDRFDGKAGDLTLFLEGSRPTRTGNALGAISSAMDNLAGSLPVVIDAQCSALCANSVNIQPMNLQKIYAYGSEDLSVVDFFLPVFPPFFVFFFTFIISAITFQRERVSGTLERLLISPLGFNNVVIGYVMGFALFASIQAIIVLSFVLALIDMPLSAYQIMVVGLITFSLLLVGLTLGLLASYLAKNEFQAIQFIPIVILPQIFLADMIWSIDDFPPVFQWLSVIMPLTHANQAMREVLLKGVSVWQIANNLLILALMFIFLVSAMTLISKRFHKQ
ncbi:MAG: ABC transporter permease [Reinekea forsetii]|nr:ABC transporter permease [Reinekea forsetii]